LTERQRKLIVETPLVSDDALEANAAFASYDALLQLRNIHPAAPSANVLALLLVQTMELAGAYTMVRALFGNELDWEIRLLLRRHQQDLLDVHKILIERIQKLGGVELIMTSILRTEGSRLEVVLSHDALLTSVEAIALGHLRLALHAKLLLRRIAPCVDVGITEFIAHHIVRRNERDGWLLTERLEVLYRHYHDPD
jgi:hypothetical protein